MHEYGFLSVMPPVIAIILAIWTRQVYVSLIFGLFLGWLIINDGNVFLGFLDTLYGLVDVFTDPGNTRTIMFSALIGGVILFIQRSGGVEGFMQWINIQLEKLDQKGGKGKKIWVQLMAWMTGVIIFIESSISPLVIGSLFRPIFDKLKISREKLAYIADSSSAPTCILIPFNGWGALIMGLLLTQGFHNPFQVMMQTIVFNFYPILTLLGVVLVILFKWDLPAMKRAEARTMGGELLWPNAQPMVSEEITEVLPKEGVKPKLINMVIPLLVMVSMMPTMLIYTGWEQALIDFPQGSWIDRAFHALGQGSGSPAVLVGVVVSILVSMVLYSVQGIFNLKENVEIVFKGISGLMPIALLLLFAFAIGTVCKELQTGQYLAQVARQWLSPSLVPFLIFIMSSFIAFSTGTSWGTFAIMIAIAVPMARQMEVNEIMAVAAALGGGIFGDHCSPISDTTILSSMAAATDHIDHVKTQMPYALIVGGITALLYLGLGMIMH
ncbi:MAG: sodium:solute symporter [Saprospiraceae bacterium]|nr:sodium:solute symporter [Saprospiraceae bacterium]